MKFCPKCGAKLEEGRKFCTNCGNLLVSNASSQSDNNVQSKVNLKKESIAQPEEHKSESFDIDEKVSQADETIVDHEAVRDSLNNAMSTSADLNENSRNNNSSNREAHNNYKTKPSNKSSLKIVLGIICGVVVVAGIITGIFFNTIRANYYMSKCNSSYITQEKLNYAEKAILCSKNSKTKAFVKQVFSDAAENDIDEAEKKLDELKNVLDQNDYKEIASEVKNKKLDKLYGEGQYDEALSLFKDINDLGGDFKKSSHYDDIMLNVISRLTGTSVAGSKNNLMEDSRICFDNFDDDPYDEILEVTGGDYYGDDIKINLYKYSDGQYRQVDSKPVNNCWDPEICGVYDYAKDTCGMYLKYSSDDGETGLGVFDADGGSIQLKGAVFSNNYTKPDDVNNDGIYEILSNSVSMFSNSSKGVSKWYKINPNGGEPSEISGNAKSSSDSSSKKEYSNDISDLNNVDYLFPQSSSEFLSDDDVKNLSKDELAIARNEIFARYGYIFNTKEYADYFNSKSWYTPDADYDGNIERLNKYEKANVELIKEYEAK